jgi:hypothetical protein
MERDLVGAAHHELRHFFSRQLPVGREAIVTAGGVELEVRFQVLEARTVPDGRPDAYITLRELRRAGAPNRPEQYWYGLTERTPAGDWLYEAFHHHREGKRGLTSHFQVELSTEEGGPIRQLEWVEVTPVHLVRAVELLMERYYTRLAQEEPDEVDAQSSSPAP